MSEVTVAAVANKPTCSFIQAGCPSCRPTNSVKALKGNGFRSAIPEVRNRGLVRGKCLQVDYLLYSYLYLPEISAHTLQMSKLYV